MELDAVFVLWKLHKLPNNPEKWQPRFDPDDRTLAEDHSKSYMQDRRLRNVIHEDIVCWFFPILSKGKR